MIFRILIFLLFSLVIFPVSAKKRGFEPPEGEVSVGPGIAFTWDKSPGIAVSADASWLVSLFAFSGTIKMNAKEDDLVFSGHVEVTAYFLATIGAGSGFIKGHNYQGFAWHGFIGMPVPLNISRKTAAQYLGIFKNMFIEPYYRFTRFQGRFIHEAGVMVKVTTWKM